MRRVVLTSSVAAITDHADGHLNTESDWNTRSSLTRNPYYYSKTLAEQAAWQFVEAGKPRFDLVVINPFFVIGPSLVPGINTSHTSLIGLTNGRIPAVIALEWALVDVRDVARAHILAMENPAAAGSYIVAAETRTCPSGRRPASSRRLGRPLQAADDRPRQLVWCCSHTPCRRVPGTGDPGLHEKPSRWGNAVRQLQGPKGVGAGLPGCRSDHPRHHGGSRALGAPGQEAVARPQGTHCSRRRNTSPSMTSSHTP